MAALETNDTKKYYTEDALQYQDIIFRRTCASDDAALKNIISQNDMQSWIRLSFEKEPSYFFADNLMGESYSVIVHKKNNSDTFNAEQSMGMYACSFLPVRINGEPQYIGYLGGLRINKTYRNRLRYVKNGYDSIAKLIPDKSTRPYWFTSIASDNKPARKLLEAGLKGLPLYSPVGEMKTMAVSVSQAKKNGILQHISADDIDELIAFYHQQTNNYQFAPVLTRQWLSQLTGDKGLSLDDFFIVRKQDVIVGCFAIWDQRSFKQTRVKGYQFPLNKIRLAYNLFSVITRRTLLPRPGCKLEQVYLSFTAFSQVGEDLFVLAIEDVLSKIKEKNAAIAVIGLSMENPLAALIEKHFHTHTYQTCIESVSWNAPDQPDLNSNSVQPEVAVL